MEHMLQSSITQFDGQVLGPALVYVVGKHCHFTGVTVQKVLMFQNENEATAIKGAIRAVIVKSLGCAKLRHSKLYLQRGDFLK